MTKFIDFTTSLEKKSKKTVTTHVLSTTGEWIKDNTDYENWDNIAFIGCDRNYGDLFKIWDNNTSNNFIICKGIKGDEFNG